MMISWLICTNMQYQKYAKQSKQYAIGFMLTRMHILHISHFADGICRGETWRARRRTRTVAGTWQRTAGSMAGCLARPATVVALRQQPLACRRSHGESSESPLQVGFEVLGRRCFQELHDAAAASSCSRSRSRRSRVASFQFLTVWVRRRTGSGTKSSDLSFLLAARAVGAGGPRDTPCPLKIFLVSGTLAVLYFCRRIFVDIKNINHLRSDFTKIIVSYKIQIYFEKIC